MNYLGGKFRQGPAIARFIHKNLRASDMYVEPFCGALGAAWRVAEMATGRVCMVLSDVHQPLITMWKALFSEWVPPDVITEEEYAELKLKRDPENPMTAYAGFGLSFAATYFSTYARSQRGVRPVANLRHCAALKKATMKKVDTISKHDVEFACTDYTAYADFVGCVFYLDPPYAGRSRQHKDSKPFVSDEFWDFVRNLSKNNRVFVTEFIAPKDFTLVHNFGDTVSRHWSSKGPDGTEEGIYVWTPTMKRLTL